MIEGGVSALQDLSRYMPDIAKAATASRDSAQSWAQAALATRDKLNIAPDDFRFAQNMLYSVAKAAAAPLQSKPSGLTPLPENRRSGERRHCGTDRNDANRHEKCP